jgi:hypothetical protein
MQDCLMVSAQVIQIIKNRNMNNRFFCLITIFLIFSHSTISKCQNLDVHIIGEINNAKWIQLESFVNKIFSQGKLSKVNLYFVDKDYKKEVVNSKKPNISLLKSKYIVSSISYQGVDPFCYERVVERIKLKKKKSTVVAIDNGGYIGQEMVAKKFTNVSEFYLYLKNADIKQSISVLVSFNIPEINFKSITVNGEKIKKDGKLLVESDRVGLDGLLLAKDAIIKKILVVVNGKESIVLEINNYSDSILFNTDINLKIGTNEVKIKPYYGIDNDISKKAEFVFYLDFVEDLQIAFINPSEGSTLTVCANSSKEPVVKISFVSNIPPEYLIFSMERYQKLNFKEGEEYEYLPLKEIEKKAFKTKLTKGKYEVVDIIKGIYCIRLNLEGIQESLFDGHYEHCSFCDATRPYNYLLKLYINTDLSIDKSKSTVASVSGVLCSDKGPVPPVQREPCGDCVK